MLGLLRKTLTRTAAGVFVLVVSSASCPMLLGSDASGHEPQNDPDYLARLEFELAHGFGTRTFGGTQRHHLTFAGIRYEQAFIARHRRFLNNLRWNVSLFAGTRFHPSEAFLVGLNPGLRYYLPCKIGRLRPFIEGGAGAMITDIGSPNLGSKFQFNEQIGLGYEWDFTQHSSIKISYRFLHISNAGLRNPNRGVNAHLLVLAWSTSL